MNPDLIAAVVITIFFFLLLTIGLQIILPNSMFNKWQWRKLLKENE